MATEKKHLFNEKIAALKGRTSQQAAQQFAQAIASSQIMTTSRGGPISGSVRRVS